MASATIDGVKAKDTRRKAGVLSRHIKLPLPLLPLLIFFALFFIWPLGEVFLNAFRSNEGVFTLSNIQTIFHDPYKSAFKNSINLGLISALTGAIPGALISYIIVRFGGRNLRKVVASISGVLANTGGVPLAFMFLAAFGPQGLVTQLIKFFGFDIYSHGFTLFSFSGLIIVYSYFQIPIMVIVFTPAISSLRREWKDAAENLGASKLSYWRFIGIPILLPSFIAAYLLLFASAFAAFATARSMTVGNIALVPLQIGVLLDGNVTVNQFNLGYALAMGMIIISILAMVPYLLIQKRTARWQQ